MSSSSLLGSQRRRFFSNAEQQHLHQQLQRSNSPSDHSSDSSLGMSPPAAVDMMMDGSQGSCGNNAAARSTSSHHHHHSASLMSSSLGRQQVSRTLSRGVRRNLTPNYSSMDHSWCAGGSRRRTNSTAQNGSGDLRSSFTTMEDGIKRHHSGESYLLSTVSPRGNTNTPARSLSGARQRISSNTANNNSTSNNNNNNIGNTSPLSPVSQRHHVTPRRNISSGDFMDSSPPSLHPQDSYGKPLMMNHPYGMLNPSKSKRRLFHSTNGGLPRWQFHHKQLIALFGFFTLTILGVAVYQHDAMLQEALLIKEQEVDHHILHSKELEKRLQTLRSHTLDLEERLEQWEHHNNAVERSDGKLDLGTQRRLFHLEHSNLKMQQDIQAMCTRLVKEKFGHGPKYYVEMKLEFDQNSNVYDDKEDGDTIILETAPIDYMPHAVYLFLEQVDHGLYDGTSFHRNAAHMVQAGPHFNLQHHTDPHSKFRHAPSLNSVIFQEYAPEMAHKQYTVGYPGRPGGPDFYVNMRDNSSLHGPGGQHHHTSDVVIDADPCFARIVSGIQTIERVHRSDVEESGFHDAIIHPVIITKMRVLPPDYVLPHSNSNSDSQDAKYY